MRCGVRIKVFAGIALFIGLVIVTLVLEDKCETYDPVGYIQASVPWLQSDDEQPAPLGEAGPEDKIIVVPSLEEEDVSWVTDELSE